MIANINRLQSRTRSALHAPGDPIDGTVSSSKSAARFRRDRPQTWAITPSCHKVGTAANGPMHHAPQSDGVASYCGISGRGILRRREVWVPVSIKGCHPPSSLGCRCQKAPGGRQLQREAPISSTAGPESAGRARSDRVAMLVGSGCCWNAFLRFALPRHYRSRSHSELGRYLPWMPQLPA